ncbi:hypothetical protein BU26DRAFT_514872 [Trematosphaeria pertusa]|uniref:Uncharacterized protein n=1 Tax=Trematosphaeria pertusa TaxID=390896 RepID=A0A6A6IWZ5_9PLEO|nr:uncharacterized protein BU26DRAFT_514872 [Trematosphaeria pertusa]KAF2255075.1 hypothetical protein BU26DRAFT_514872 [Trematosphaeria pertusa]
MAPFRNRDRSNRSGRGQVEHNVLEGLPINQYKEVEITIGPSSSESKEVDKDAWPEPPMPRDSHMLPEHSQQLLRAARAGRMYKPPAPPEEDKEAMDEEDETKEVSQGFTVKKWAKVPRHLEEPEPEYLAKRRKGLPSQYAMSSQVPAQPTPMRETKVKKTDAEGNVSVYKVLVPEGQAVEGEIQPTDAVSEAAPTTAAPGTVVEGVGVVNAEGMVVANDVMQHTPPRRRPPPPKKKKKSGPGRGKKKVVFVEGAEQQGTPASTTGSDLLAVPGVKQEGGSVEPSEGGDTPMADAGDEEEGSGEEGSEDEEHEEGTHSPTPAIAVTPSKTPAEPANAPVAEPPKEEPIVEAVPIADTAPVTDTPKITPAEPTPPSAPPGDDGAAVATQIEPEKQEKTDRDPSSSPELPLSAMAHSRQNSLNQLPTIPPLEPAAPEPVSAEEPVPPAEPVESVETVETVAPVEPAPAPLPPQEPAAEEIQASDGEPDLLGSLERQLEKDSESMAAP